MLSMISVSQFSRQPLTPFESRFDFPDRLDPYQLMQRPNTFSRANRAAIRESGFESGFALGTFIREYFENQVHLLYENSTFITQFFPKIRMECSENGDKADCAHCTQFAGACALKFA